MNKKIYYLLALVFSFSLLTFIACGDDDDDPVVTDNAALIAGTYNGDLSVKIEGQDDVVTKSDLALERTGDNKVKVSLKNFSFGELSLGDIIVDNIPVTKSNEKFNLAATTTAVTLDLFGAPISVDVTVSGTVEGNKLDLKIAVSKVPLLENLNVTFSGNKK